MFEDLINQSNPQRITRRKKCRWIFSTPPVSECLIAPFSLILFMHLALLIVLQIAPKIGYHVTRLGPSEIAMLLSVTSFVLPPAI